MTYLVFLLVFIVPWVAFGAVAFARSRDPLKSYFARGLLLLSAMAVVYTTPWDNYLVMTGVWKYFNERVVGRIGYVPLEEYSFFILQTYLTGFWTYFVTRKIVLIEDQPTPTTSAARWLGGLVWLLLLACGFWCARFENGRYMALILIWSVPVALLQWVIGGANLWQNRRLYFAALALPTLYLWAVDTYAISRKIWMISDAQTLGVKIGILPLEEATFFLMTNVMLVQGLILFISMRSGFPALYHKLGLKRSA